MHKRALSLYCWETRWVMDHSSWSIHWWYSGNDGLRRQRNINNKTQKSMEVYERNRFTPFQALKGKRTSYCSVFLGTENDLFRTFFGEEKIITVLLLILYTNTPAQLIYLQLSKNCNPTHPKWNLKSKCMLWRANST